jgi:hypothetical protein
MMKRGAKLLANRYYNKILLFGITTILAIGIIIPAAFAENIEPQGVSVGTYDFSWNYDDYTTKTSMSFHINTGICAVSGSQYANEPGAEAATSYWIAKRGTIGWQRITEQVEKYGNGSINPLYFYNLPQNETLALQGFNLGDSQYAYGYLYDGY